MIEAREHTAGKSKFISVIRYVVTFANTDGYRQLVGPAWGSRTHATPEDAQKALDSIKANNSDATIRQHYGNPDTLKVTPCECYPVHFDPMTCYFGKDEQP